MTKWQTLLIKELRHLFRDTKTIIQTVVVPTFLTPLLIGGIVWYISSIAIEESKKDYDVIFSKYCKVSTLLNAEVTGDNSSLKLSFDIVLKEDKSYEDFIKELSKLKTLSEVVAVAAKNDVDY